MSFKDGEINDFTISETNENKKYMPSAKGNFGLFGMMYEITMRVYPLLIVEVNDQHMETYKLFGPTNKVKNNNLKLKGWFKIKRVTLFY